MSENNPRHGWALKKKQVTVTTWKFRLVVLLGSALILYLSYPAWLVAVGRALVHEEDLEPADVLVIENFDTDYFVFAAARELIASGYSSRVLIPVAADAEKAELTAVEKGFVEVMSRVAGIEEYEILPVRHEEPISFNVASQIADFLEPRGMRSVIVVSPGFRSARSHLVYDRILTPRGIRVQGFAARGPLGIEDWWSTWHGMQDVGLEFSKLAYYRLWVL